MPGVVCFFETIASFFSRAVSFFSASLPVFYSVQEGGERGYIENGDVRSRDLFLCLRLHEPA